MDERLVPPCLELELRDHRVLVWATQQARKRKSGVIRMELGEMTSQAARDLGMDWWDVSNGFTTLMDGGRMEKVEMGWAVPTPCACKNNYSGEVARNALAAFPQRLSMSRSDYEGADENPAFDFQREAPGGMEESAHDSGIKYPRSQRVQLAQEFFPQLCRANGITVLPGGHNGTGLAHHLRIWAEQYDVNNTLARTMMEEFVQHPQWCLRSRRGAWQVFVSRRVELLTILAKRRERDATPTGRGKGESFWWGRGGRHTPSSYSVP